MNEPPADPGSNDPPPRRSWGWDDWTLLLWPLGGALLLVMGVGVAAFVVIFSWMHERLTPDIVVTAAMCGTMGGGLGGTILWIRFAPLPRSSKRAARRDEPTQE